jgi:hypothetical protein
MQWHPLFAHLLRPVVEQHYDVQTNVAVSDVPREADILLLRRTTAGHPPFHGVWRHLTRWNILEFKAPTVFPRRRDLDLLVELGLGIDRRLNDRRTQEGHRPVTEGEVSFWYIGHKLGPRFLRDAVAKLGRLKSVLPGVRSSRLLGHPLLLVSSVEVPLDEESLPLHVVGLGNAEHERSLARLVVQNPKLRQTYVPWLFSLHKRAWKEAQSMAQALGEELEIDVKELVEYVGLGRAIEQLGPDRVIHELGPDRVIHELGPDRVIRELGLDGLLNALTAEQREELRRRLEPRGPEAGPNTGASERA